MGCRPFEREMLSLAIYVAALVSVVSAADDAPGTDYLAVSLKASGSPQELADAIAKSLPARTRSELGRRFRPQTALLRWPRDGRPCAGRCRKQTRMIP